MATSDPVQAYVGLGANLGDTQSTLLRCLQELDRLPVTRLVRVSSFYRTAPIDATGPDYVNAVACLATSLDPYALLDHLQRIEQGAGRERPYRNAPRTLDLDLLLHGDVVQDDPRLTLPHPRMHQRAFVLVPLAEIAPARVSVEDLRRVENQPISVLNAAVAGQAPA